MFKFTTWGIHLYCILKIEWFRFNLFIKPPFFYQKRETKETKVKSRMSYRGEPCFWKMGNGRIGALKITNISG